MTTLFPLHSNYSYSANRAKRPQFGSDNEDWRKAYSAFLSKEEEKVSQVLEQHRTDERDKFKAEAKAKGYKDSDLVNAFADIKLNEQDEHDRIYTQSFVQSMFNSLESDEAVGLTTGMRMAGVNQKLLDADKLAKEVLAQQTRQAEKDAKEALKKRKATNADGDTFQTRQQ